MLACRAITSLSPVAAFAGIDVQTHRRVSSATSAAHRRQRAWRALGAQAQNDDGGEEEDGDPLLDDQREGMADAFSALDSLSADDFDDLRPPSSTAETGATEGFDMEASSQLFADMQIELSTRGEEGVYEDMLGDLSGDDPTASSAEEDEATELRQALDEAAEGAAVLDDADGLGNLASAAGEVATPLTTADVSTDILTQDIAPAVSMEEFMSSAVQEAVEAIENTPEASSASSTSSSSSAEGVGRTEDIARATEELLENAELRKEIEDIFDRAGDQLRSELDAIKQEQEAFARDAAQQGTEVSAAEEQRISEAEQSVARMIQKVARETDGVQKAMDELQLAKDQASEGDSGSIEEAALDLKKGGLLKQAALIGGLLLGSRAFTEGLLVVGSAYGEEHFVPALVQGVIALACAAYFFLVK